LTDLGKCEMAQMTHAVDLLRRARELIGSDWTQGADARAADGKPVDPWSEGAAAWSLLGALVAALEESEEQEQGLPLTELALALDALAGFVDDDSLVRWNDLRERTLGEVESALGAAAAEAQRSSLAAGFSDN
jgi:hypothetical protein